MSLGQRQSNNLYQGPFTNPPGGNIPGAEVKYPGVAQKDFLEGDLNTPITPAIGSSPSELAALYTEQLDVMRDIRTFLYQSAPDVLTQLVIQNAGFSDLVINDTLKHQAYFQVSGKPVPVYALLVWSTYDKTIAFSPHDMGAPLDGMQLTATTPNYPIFIPLTTQNVWIWCPTLATPLNVNGNADATHGGLFIQAYTTSDYQPNRTRY